MFGFPCAGKIRGCDLKPSDRRFRPITCLHCRSRRRHYGLFTEPKYWIKYTYLSWYAENIQDYWDKGGYRYRLSNGGKLRVHYDFTLYIDPRGLFTKLRCAAIIVIDKFMVKFGTYQKTDRGFSHGMRRPFAEFCEFLASYP